MEKLKAMKSWLYSSLIPVFLIGCSQPTETEPAIDETPIEVYAEAPAVDSDDAAPSKALEPKMDPGEAKDQGEEAPYHNAPEQDEIDKTKSEKLKSKK